MFSRSVDFFGPEGLAKMQAARVLVIGLGGVGSHAAQALVRSGVGQLLLVDFDQLTLSSLNRHAFATQADVGKNKAALTRDFLKAVNPACQIQALDLFFHEDTADQILTGQIDAVVDAIDSLVPKLALLQRCVSEQHFVVSSMGASSRSDPTRLHLADINDTYGCPLARRVRKGLRKRGIYHGITCAFSDEQALPPLAEENDESPLQRGRPRLRLPSLSTMPGIFGYTLASEVIRQLSGLDAHILALRQKP